MEKLWTNIFDQLSLEPKNVNVLMTDSPFASKEDRTQMAQIMFDKLQVKSLAVMNTAALSMYSSGRVSGLIAEVGEGISYTVPVFQGYALPHAQIKLDLAGKDVTEKLIEQLTAEGIANCKEDHEHIRSLKEQMCSVS